MSDSFKIRSHPELEFTLFYDDEARANLRLIVDGLNSDFLEEVLLTLNQREHDEVRIIEHCNALLTIQFPGNKLIGFVVLEDEEQFSRINLHVIYVLRSYRQQGYGKILLSVLDTLALSARMPDIRTVATASVVKSMFEKHAAKTRGIKYTILFPYSGDRLAIEDKGFESR